MGILYGTGFNSTGSDHQCWYYSFYFYNSIILGALAFADIITLSSTSALTMVFNCLLATNILGEVFTRYDLLSIVLISMGSSLCVLFSNF
jgi:drug/metabolite transporter (DMT)-like permease